MAGNADFLLLFSVATVTMLLLAGTIVLFVVFYQKRMIQEQMKRQAMEFEFQQKMMQAELDSQESERRKVAADLHDSIGGMLSTIRVGLTTVARSLPNPTDIDETKRMLDDTISSVRQISRDLMPTTLERFGLSNALKELCERVEATAKVSVQFQDSTGSNCSLDKQRQLMAFRIVQELLNNAIKHAQAGKIDVSLSCNKSLSIEVEDDGVGFDVQEIHKNKQGKGLGLFNIENRARLLGGALVFEKARTRGTKALLTVPV